MPAKCLKCGDDAIKTCPCLSAQYCSVECQREGWKAHKKWCCHFLQGKLDEKSAEVGSDSLALLDSWLDLGQIHLRCGRVARAEECLNESLRLDELHHPSDGGAVTAGGAYGGARKGDILEGLSAVYLKTERSHEAWETLDLVVRNRKKTCGQETIEVARALVSTAEALLNLGEPCTAQAKCVRAGEILGRMEDRGIIPPSHPEQLRTLIISARVMARQGYTEEAEYVARGGLIDASVAEDMDAVSYHMLRGALCCDMELWPVAQSSLEEGLRILRLRHPEEAEMERMLLEYLSSSLCAQGKVEEALAVRKRENKLVKKGYGKKSLKAARSAHDVGLVLKRMGKTEKAVKKIEKAAKKAANLTGILPGVSPSLMYDVALCKIHGGDLEGALESARESVRQYDQAGLQCGRSQRARYVLRKLEQGDDVDGEDRCECCGEISGNWWG